MKTLSILAVAALFVAAVCISSSSAQTVSRSFILKPAGSTNTLTLDVNGAIGTSYNLSFPGSGNAAGSPIMKVNTGAGNKNVSFGQIDLTANTAVTGDITGILRTDNGGTGLAAQAAGTLLYGSGTNPMNVLALGAPGQELRVNGAGTAPVWVNSVSNQSFSYTVDATETGFGSGFVHFNTVATAGDATIPAVVGYTGTSKIMLSLTTSTIGAQSYSVTNKTATGFDVYTAALSSGDVITVMVIN